ncbi:MAG: aminotransferase [Dehalococcoidia bacterium]|nr:aminotransferase [Dehalococcoidia bacterium]
MTTIRPKSDPAASYAPLFARRAAYPVPVLFRAGAASRQEVIPLTYGFPDPGSFPFADLVEATARALDEGGETALQYGPIAGDERFRAHVVERLRDDGLDVSADNIIVTSGGSQGIQLVTEMVVDPGDAIIVEAPTFIGALQTFRNAEAEVHEVPLDDYGMRTDKLAEVLATLAAAGKRPKLVYTIPTFHNPAGVSMPPERRHELIGLARQYGVLILEDDAYSELRLDGERAPFLYELEPEGLVIQVRTYSKILAAGLRLGYVVAPAALVPRLLPLKVDVGTSPFVSRLAAKFADNGRLAAHIEGLRGIYRDRRDAMLAALDEHAPPPTTWTRPEGGFFVWLTLPAGLDSSELLPRAVQAGVSFIPGSANFTHGDGSRHLRLAFSFLPPGQLSEGVRRLGMSIQAALARIEIQS